MIVYFHVEGIPVQQGSKRPIQTKAAGGYKGGLRVMDVNAKRLKPWRSLVAEKANEAMGEHLLLEGPLSANFIFVFPRPKKHAKMKSPPKWVCKVPDLDKLERAMYDGMTGVVYFDDKQICKSTSVKIFGVEPGVIVTIDELGEK